MSDSSKKIDIVTLLQSMESADPKAVENLREALKKDPELKKELSIEVGRHFLSCIAVSEVFDLNLEKFMNASSPDELAEFFGADDLGSAKKESCCDDECDDEDGCCGTC